MSLRVAGNDVEEGLSFCFFQQKEIPQTVPKRLHDCTNVDGSCSLRVALVTQITDTYGVTIGILSPRERDSRG